MKKFLIGLICCFVFSSCSSNSPEQSYANSETQEDFETSEALTKSEWTGNLETKKTTMTLDELRNLASKGVGLTFEDLNNYYWVNVSSNTNTYIMSFAIEGGYRMTVYANKNKVIGKISFESVWDSGGTGIDIRYDDVDEFIRTHPSSPALSIVEMKKIAQEYLGKEVNAVDLNWWEFDSEFPHNCKDPKKQAIFESLEEMTDEYDEYGKCDLFIDSDSNLIAVSRKTGNVFIPEFDSDGWVVDWIKVQ